MQGISRREVGTGITGAGAALLRRRLDAIEGRLSALVLGLGGCPTCRPWGPNAIVAVGDAALDADRPDLAGVPTDGGPVASWPASLRCDRCGRRPETVIRLMYVPADELPWTRGV